MKYKKSMIIIMLAIFLFSIAAVSASDVNETAIASGDDGQIELSQSGEVETDNLQTSEEQIVTQTDNDENLSASNELDVLSVDEVSFTTLEGEILSTGGNVELQHDYYTYQGFGSTISIYGDNRIIDGRGAVIDMAESTIQAFYVDGSGITIKNLTIKNANYEGYGGAIYFSKSGTVENCNFTNNKATGDYSYGGAIYFNSSGTVKNCNFVDNKATSEDGGAIYFSSSGTVKNCNFTNNTASDLGGAILFAGTGNVTNCNFTNNSARYGGAIRFSSTGNVTNCNFSDNQAQYYGGAVYFYNKGNVTKCNFTNNKATVVDSYGGAVYFLNKGNVTKCNFTNNSAYYGGAVYFDENSEGDVTNCSFTNNSATKNGGAIYFDEGSNGRTINCNFTGNNATVYGGAVYFQKAGNVTNCNFTNNSARYGGAIDFAGTGTVTNCNFTNNKATGNYSYGGAILFASTGTVTNCNFTNNTASDLGGAILFTRTGSVTNCNFANNKATDDYGRGGAIWMSLGSVETCNFTDNKADYGGAIDIYKTGNVTNCTFTNNAASCEGGAILFLGTGNVTNCTFTNNTASFGGAISMALGSVENCNFINNKVTSFDAGAVCFSNSGTVINCNFINNTAINGEGGAILFASTGTVTNCNFTGNNATTGSAIYFYSTSATKTVSNSRFLNNRANAEALEVTKNDNNITITFTGKDNLLNAIYSRNDAEVTFTNVTYWSANGIATTESSAIKPPRSNKETGQNITVGVVVNGELVLSGVYPTDENGMIVLDVKAGENYYITARHETDSYYTEAEKTISNMTYVNVTSQTTNNKTVNITAKSNILNEVMPGKLLFIVPNSNLINATYAGNGTWWALHTFDGAGDYNVNASYIGLDNVTINNATISIRYDASVEVNNKTLDLLIDDTFTIVATTTPKGLNVSYVPDDSGVYSIDENGRVTALRDGKGSILIKVEGNAGFAVNSTIVNVTVSKVPTEINVLNDTLVLAVGDEIATGATLTPDDAGNLTYSISNSSVVIVEEGKIIALAEGNSTITVSFEGDQKYLEAENKTINVTVHLNDASVTVDNDTLDLKIDETYAINATRHPDTILLDITYKSSDNSVATVDENGIVTAVGEGTAIITVSVGDDEIYAKNSTIVNVTVRKIATKLTAKAVTTTYNINKNLVITLTDDEGNSLGGVKVSVKLNKAKNYTTDNNGQIKIATGSLVPNTYTAKISFAGNENYTSSSTTAKVKVKKATPKITAKAKTFKSTTKTKKYTIKLKDNTGNPIKNAKVYLKVKGVTYKATTNKYGKATFKITKLTKTGTHKAVITYKKNSYYYKVTKKAKLTVKPVWKTISKGSNAHKTVKKIQQALKNNGYYLTYAGHYLMIDGIYEDCTERSVKEFQMNNGLKVTGKVDYNTAKKLKLVN